MKNEKKCVLQSFQTETFAKPVIRKFVVKK